MRRIFHIVGIILLVVLVVFVSTYIWLRSSSGERFLKNKATKLVENATGLQASISTLQTNIFSHLILSDVVIQDSSSSGRIRIPTVNVNYTLFPLIHSTVEIDSILSRGIHLELPQSFIDRLSSGKSRKQGSGKSKFSLNIGYVDVDSVSVEYTNRQQDLTLLVSGMRAQSLGQRLFNIQIDAAGGAYQGKIIPTSRGRIVVSEKNSLWKIDTLNVRSAHSFISINGKYLTKSGLLELSFNNKIGRDYIAFAKQLLPDQLAGQTTISPIYIQGELSRQDSLLQYSGYLKTAEFSYDTLSAYNPDIGFSGNQDTLNIEHFSAIVGKSTDTLRVKGFADWKKRSIYVDAITHLSSLDYIQRFIPIDSTLDASVDFSAKGSIPYANLKNITGEFTLHLDNVKYAERAFPDIRATAHIADNRFSAKIIQGKNTVTSSGLNQWPLQFQAEANIVDFTEISAITNIALSGSTQVKATGRIGEKEKLNISGMINSDNSLNSNGLSAKLHVPYSYKNNQFSIENGIVQIADLKPDTINADVQLQPNLEANVVIREPKAENQSKQGILKASVKSDSAKQYTGEIHLNQIAMQRWLGIGTDLSGEITGQLHLGTTFTYANQNLSGKGRLQINSLRLSKTVFDSTVVAFNLDSTGIDIADGRSYYGDYIAEIGGHIPFDSSEQMSVKINANDLPLSSINPFVPDDLYLQGQLNPNITIAGTVASPEITGKVLLDSGYVVLSPHLSPIRELSAAIHFQGTQFEVQYISFRYNDYPVNISGTGSYTPSFNGMVEVKPGGTITLFYSRDMQDSLSVAMHQIPLDLLKPFVPSTLTAATDLNGSIKGRHLFTDKIDVVTDFSASRAGYKDGPDWSMKLAAEIENQELIVHNAELGATPGKAVLQARVPIHLDSTSQQLFHSKDSVNASINIDHFQLNQLNPLLQTTTVKSGVINSSITVTGKFGAPDISGNFNLDSLNTTSALQTLNTTDGTAKISFTGQTISIQTFQAKVNSVPVNFTGKVNYAGKSFKTHLTGTVDTSGKLTADIYNNSEKDSLDGLIDVQGLRITDLTKIRQIDRNMQGSLNFQLGLRGSRTAPIMDFSGNIQDLQMEKVQFADVQLNGGYKNRVVRLDSLYIANKNSQILLAGEYHASIDLHSFSVTPQDTPYQFDLNVRSFPLTTLDVFTKGTMNFAGNFDASLHYSNSTKRTGIYGSLNIDSFGMDLPYFQQSIQNGNLQLQFAQSEIQINKGQFFIDKTPVNLQGNLDFTDPEAAQYDLTLNTDKLSLSRKEEIQFTLSPTNLRIVSRKGEPVLIDGKIQFASFKYTKPVQNFRLLSLIGTRTVRPPQYTQQMMQDVRLNLAIQMLQNGKVENNVANIDFTTDMQLSGPLFQPRYTGRVQSNSGKIFYLGKTFEIEQGNVLFGDNPGLNPNLNITAKTVIPAGENVDNIDYTIRLNITGTLHQPQVQFSSDPSTRPHTNEPLSYSDIIGLLAIGKPRDQFSVASGEGNLQQLLVRQAQRFSSQRIASYVEYRVGRLLDLDQVAIHGNLFDLTGANGPTFTAQKSLSSKLTLTYSTAIGNSNVQGVRLNYELTPKIYIVTETNQQEDYGIDLKYKIKFK